MSWGLFFDFDCGFFPLNTIPHLWQSCKYCFDIKSYLIIVRVVFRLNIWVNWRSNAADLRLNTVWLSSLTVWGVSLGLFHISLTLWNRNSSPPLLIAYSFFYRIPCIFQSAPLTKFKWLRSNLICYYKYIKYREQYWHMCEFCNSSQQLYTC